MALTMKEKKWSNGLHGNKKFCASKDTISWAPVAHTCNPSYSGDRDQKDHGSKPAQTNSLRLILKKTQHKKGLVEWHKV
jgi:hypothetical protein